MLQSADDLGLTPRGLPAVDYGLDRMNEAASEASLTRPYLPIMHG